MQLCSQRQPGNGEIVIGYYTTSYRTCYSQGILSFIVLERFYFYIVSLKSVTVIVGQSFCVPCFVDTLLACMEYF
jgi:hypothetical protein